jgi:hypothetical protein
VIHLLGNMWFLFLFGGSVEGKLGHKWMATIYFACLLVSDLAQYLFAPQYSFAIGASGAVGGMIGAYWFLFSRAQVDFLVMVFLRPRVIPLTVNWIIAFLFGWDVMMWFLEKYLHVDNHVANSAHIGGLICGVLCGLLLRLFTHVTLDGEDMYTRWVVGRLRRKASAAYFAEKAAPKLPDEAPARAAIPSWDDSGVPERIPLDPETPAQQSEVSES